MRGRKKISIQRNYLVHRHRNEQRCLAVILFVQAFRVYTFCRQTSYLQGGSMNAGHLQQSRNN
jgi:hypothetical protein